MTKSQETSLHSGAAVLEAALDSNVPIVAVLGQRIGWRTGHRDSVLNYALKKAHRTGDNWNELLGRESLPDGFYEWLAERFFRRGPSHELRLVADAPLSAVYTSCIDPSLSNLFSTCGRQPEQILVGDPPPLVSRSKRRVPIFYLFGRAGGGGSNFVPPSAIYALQQRRVNHTTAMLNTLNETATALGLIVIDGFQPPQDWLRAEDLLAVLGSASNRGVLWCGEEPVLTSDDRYLYENLLEGGVIIRVTQSFASIFATLRSQRHDAWNLRWDEPGIVSFSDDTKLITTPRLRLSTQATMSIVDDAWIEHLSPLTSQQKEAAFSDFHSIPSGPQVRIDGIRRGFAITRDFENSLERQVLYSIEHHHKETGPTILHGQSGVGKSIALSRLALTIRDRRLAAVLFAYSRSVQATDISQFAAEVDRLNQVTVVVVDATLPNKRYSDLLQALRSRGHRVVVVGSSYKIESFLIPTLGRFVEAPAELSDEEQKRLLRLAKSFDLDETKFRNLASERHALARFFWGIPSSRPRISEGLGKEARTTEREIRSKGTSEHRVQPIGTIGQALVEAGFNTPTGTILADDALESYGVNSAAARTIDYVMAVARLYMWMPVNLLLRATLNQEIYGQSSVDIETIRLLFFGQDLFRWDYLNDAAEVLVVGARLQLEAELICDRRLGGPVGEADRLIELIGFAIRSGPEQSEETKFLLDLIHSIGPDGPFGERYRDSYSRFAEALRELRERTGIPNARLMLQEATLRRHYVRTHSLEPEEKASILDAARATIDDALHGLDQKSGVRMYASRRTRENLWVERAATYGYLATDSAHRRATIQEVWSNYTAARYAVEHATARVDTYFPLDIGLWLPVDILRMASDRLESYQRYELEADIRATLDLVDPEVLDPIQVQKYHRQRFRAGEALSDEPLAEDAFKELQNMGSTVGYYLRARELAPTRPENRDTASPEECKAARDAVKYLRAVYSAISSDTRCLRLLLSCEWTSITGRWLFRGQRQPLPYRNRDRTRLRSILLDLEASSSTGTPARFRYLESVLNWLISDESRARHAFRELSSETEYVERGRVTRRHIIANKYGQPMLFNGIVHKKMGETRWSVYVDKLSRNVDLIQSPRDTLTIDIGTNLKKFGVCFNFLGPIVERFPS